MLPAQPICPSVSHCLLWRWPLPSKNCLDYFCLWIVPNIFGVADPQYLALSAWLPVCPPVLQLKNNHATSTWHNPPYWAEHSVCAAISLCNIPLQNLGTDEPVTLSSIYWSVNHNGKVMIITEVRVVVDLSANSCNTSQTSCCTGCFGVGYNARKELHMPD